MFFNVQKSHTYTHSRTHKYAQARLLARMHARTETDTLLFILFRHFLFGFHKNSSFPTQVSQITYWEFSIASCKRNFLQIMLCFLLFYYFIPPKLKGVSCTCNLAGVSPSSGNVRSTDRCLRRVRGLPSQSTYRARATTIPI